MVLKCDFTKALELPYVFTLLLCFVSLVVFCTFYFELKGKLLQVHNLHVLCFNVVHQ